jgi:hypothetical protein
VVPETRNQLCMITYSVFRLAARRTGSATEAPLSESAPVSEKRVGLSRGPAPRLWAFNGPGWLKARAIDGLASRGTPTRASTVVSRVWI